MTGTLLDRILVLTVAVVATTLTHVLADGSGPGAETIFWAPGAVDGLSRADLPIGVVWLVAMAACAWLEPGRAAALDRALIGAIAVILTFLTFTLLKGDGPDSGRTVVGFSPDYGINVGDVPILLAWVVGVVACGALAWRDRRPPEPTEPRDTA